MLAAAAISASCCAATIRSPSPAASAPSRRRKRPSSAACAPRSTCSPTRLRSRMPRSATWSRSSAPAPTASAPARRPSSASRRAEVLANHRLTGFLGIDRLNEIQPLRRRVEAQRCAVLRGSSAAPISSGLPLPAPDQRQAADHRAHLVMEEAARRRLGCGFPRRRARPSSLSSVLTGLSDWQWTERKVVKSWRPTSMCRALGHRLDVERHRDVPHLAALERRRRAAVEDAVEIARARCRRSARASRRRPARPRARRPAPGRTSALRPSRSRCSVSVLAMSTCAAIASAWTPASVRPARMHASPARRSCGRSPARASAAPTAHGPAAASP